MNIDFTLMNLSDYWWLYLTIAARFYGAMLICPIFNSAYLTMFLKSMLALLLAAVVFPYLATIHLEQNLFIRLFLVVKEFAYGVLLSYLISLPIWLIESAGNIVDMQRGEQFGAVVNQLTDNPDSSLGKLLSRGFITYFVSMNGMIYFFDVLFKSYALLPVNQIIPVHAGIDQYISLFGSFFYWAIIIVLPLIFLMLLLELTMGLISSFIPQLNVTILSMPLKSCVAIIALIFYIGTMFHDVIINFLGQVKKIYG